MLNHWIRMLNRLVCIFIDSAHVYTCVRTWHAHVHTLSSTRELMAFEHSPVSSQDSGERSPFPSPPTDGDKVDELF